MKIMKVECRLHLKKITIQADSISGDDVTVEGTVLLDEMHGKDVTVVFQADQKLRLAIEELVADQGFNAWTP